MTLGERKLQVLAAVVEAYIRTGEPVGSKLISELMGNTVSSATIRNEMADLAERGLLEQPHTSAGRIPTDRGFRMYLGSRMQKTPLSREDRLNIDAMLLEAGDEPEHMLDRAVQSLAYLTNCAAAATTPIATSTVVRSVQVMPIGRRTAVVVLMTSAGILKNKVCRCGFDLTPDVLRITARLITERVNNRPLIDITAAYIQTIAASIGELVFVIAPILIAILDTARDAAKAGVFVGGQNNLLQRTEYSDAGARRVFDFLGRSDELITLLDRTRSTLSISIGPETGRTELLQSSVLTAGYGINGADCGRLAIIGPMRMDYGTVLSYLEYFAERIGQLMTEMLQND